MRKILLLIPVLLNFSCQDNKDIKADNQRFSYTVDTVMVDPGEEILYLKGNLGLISEHSIPELLKAPEIAFIKDGNI